MNLRKWLEGLSSTRIIALTFFSVIFIGTVLLMLPAASRSGEWTPFLDALFTATSATCVTGLIVYDTCTHWAVFGQLVILGMIQIGGIGLMTVISMIAVTMKKRIGLRERTLIRQASGNITYSGTVLLVKRIFRGTMMFEAIGAMLLMLRFYPRFGLVKGAYYSIFHSISAFCNAGFDLMGLHTGSFSSFTAFEKDPLVSLTLAWLVIIGGIGFIVWSDILKFRHHFSQYHLHSKIVLLTTVILLIGGTVGYFVFEYSGNLSGLSVPEKVLSSFFMSASTRTAGFNTMNLNTLSESGSLLTVILMFIGGSPGSTAGGIKTTTLAVLAYSAFAMGQGREDVTAYKKTLDNTMIKHASVIVFTYLAGVLLATMVIAGIEPYPMEEILFEVTSAAATVGLGLGLSPAFGSAARIILILLMFAGRIGGMSMLMVFGEKKHEPPLKRPKEKILIG